MMLKLQSNFKSSHHIGSGISLYTNNKESRFAKYWYIFEHCASCLILHRTPLHFIYFSAPDAPPENLTGNYTNATAIDLNWNRVPEENRNGIITSYAVQYRIKDSQSSWKEIAVGANIFTLHVAKLEYYTTYEFRIAAETVIGRGPFSNFTYIRTDAYGKVCEYNSISSMQYWDLKWQ